MEIINAWLDEQCVWSKLSFEVMQHSAKKDKSDSFHDIVLILFILNVDLSRLKKCNLFIY